MSGRLWIFPVLLLAVFTDLSAGQNKRSRHLHDLHCRGCHSSTLYLLETRKMTTPESLTGHVLNYGRDDKVKLTPIDLQGIAEYLRGAYYDF